MPNYPRVIGQFLGIYPRPFVPFDVHQSYVMPANSISWPIPRGANEVLLQAITQNIRFTLDGTDPTATRGFQIVAGDPERKISISNITKLRLMREANGAVLQIQFGE